MAIKDQLHRMVEDLPDEWLSEHGTGTEQLRGVAEILRQFADALGRAAGELTPNGETIDAIRAAERGELATVGSLDDLFEDLHADD